MSLRRKHMDVEKHAERSLSTDCLCRGGDCETAGAHSRSPPGIGDHIARGAFHGVTVCEALGKITLWSLPRTLPPSTGSVTSHRPSSAGCESPCGSLSLPRGKGLPPGSRVFSEVTVVQRLIEQGLNIYLKTCCSSSLPPPPAPPFPSLQTYVQRDDNPLQNAVWEKSPCPESTCDPSGTSQKSEIRSNVSHIAWEFGGKT